MNRQKSEMIATATRRWKHITPLYGDKDFRNCFTKMGNKLVFWFNTDDNSTHVIIYNQ